MQVTTAVDLGADVMDRLKRALDTSLGKDCILETTVDNRIIGGVVAVVENQVIDGSLRTALDELGKDLIATPLQSSGPCDRTRRFALKLRPEEISSVLTQELKSYSQDLDVQERRHDPAGRRRHRPRLRPATMSWPESSIEFENGARGLVLNLEEDSIGVVIFRR